MVRVTVTRIAIPALPMKWIACRKVCAEESTSGMRVSGRKTEKELAYLQDLFVAPDWGERFAELIDAHVTLPKKGRVLYINAGTGGHAIALRQRVGQELQIVCTDENAECLELARAKSLSTKAN